ACTTSDATRYLSRLGRRQGEATGAVPRRGPFHANTCRNLPVHRLKRRSKYVRRLPQTPLLHRSDPRTPEHLFYATYAVAGAKLHTQSHRRHCARPLRPSDVTQRVFSLERERPCRLCPAAAGGLQHGSCTLFCAAFWPNGALSSRI